MSKGDPTSWIIAAATVITVAIVVFTWIAGLGGLQQDVENLKDDVAGLQNDLDQLRTEFGQLKSEVSDVRVELSDVRGEIGTIKAILERIESRSIQSVQRTPAAQSTQVDSHTFSP